MTIMHLVLKKWCEVKICSRNKPHKQYHVVLGSLLVYMEPIQVADGDAQNGKPTCENNPVQSEINRRVNCKVSIQTV